MKAFRTVLFWMHLTAGVVAGIVILIMSVTGVALTYEKQMVERTDRAAWSVPSSTATGHLPPETLLANVFDAQPGAAVAGLTMRSDPSALATVTLEGNKAILVDPYTGAVIGEPPAGLRRFFRTATSWHRYLALEGENRATGRAFTGVSNVLFLFIVCSGAYLWFPKARTWTHFKNVLWFRRALPGKARDFNWHNVIGFWSAIPLAIVVAGAVPISYSWAGNLIYRVVGEAPPVPPPAAARPQGVERRDGDRPRPFRLDGINVGWRRAEAHVPSWRAISVRFAGSPQAPLAFVIDEGYGGQPQRRGTLTVDRATGDVTKWETFSDLTPGRRLRTWFRFAHTGEFYGLTGQTIAGLVSAGGAVLVYTGIALAVRRFWSWLWRRRDRTVPARQAA